MLINTLRKILGLLKIIFYLIYIPFILIVLRYKFWRTERVFKRELLRQGLPEYVVGHMVDVFNKEWNVFAYIKRVLKRYVW